MPCPINRDDAMRIYDPQRHRRRSIRLKGYDYAQPGAYFITICTHNRTPLFGRVVNREMALNAFGEVVWACWREIPDHFSRVELDAFVAMPNHVHGIIWIVDDVDHTGKRHENVGATHASPLHLHFSHASPLQDPRGPASGSLGAVVGSFKSAVTRRINEMRGTPGARVWQRSYWEHIIRDDRALNAIRRYIAENPLRWHLDRYNPDAIGSDPLAHEIWHLMHVPVKFQHNKANEETSWTGPGS